MSRKIHYDNLTDNELKIFSSELMVQPEATKYKPSADPICLYDTDGQYVYIPFAYGEKYPRPTRENFPSTALKFHGELRPEQKIVRTEAIDNLNKIGSIILACYPGFGKTCLATDIASRIKLRTLILCHRIVLINQWKASIAKFCPQAVVHVISGREHDKLPFADFYIANAANIPKYSREYFKDIGFLVIDEAHIIMAEKLSQCMRYIVPRYVLGLSATPYRIDGLNMLLEMYFGKNKIYRQLKRAHTVYRVDTGLKIEPELNRMGKVDWNSVINDQCSNQERNELIIRLLKFFPDRVFLVLCKRVEQAEYLFRRLQEEKEDVTSLIGKNQTYLQSSRILIGTSGKVGIGFDHPRLDSLLLASDVEQYFVQYLGRVFRREDNEPIIIDLVDNFGLLIKHFRTRNEVYIEHGGTVKNFNKEFPEFRTK